ncbi:MAG: hypothetical protein IJ196_00900 [Prevotella sp.]|nr:hypothetical protein [Prevotella sp.]
MGKKPKTSRVKVLAFSKTKNQPDGMMVCAFVDEEVFVLLSEPCSQHLTTLSSGKEKADFLPEICLEVGTIGLDF